MSMPLYVDNESYTASSHRNSQQKHQLGLSKLSVPLLQKKWIVGGVCPNPSSAPNIALLNSLIIY